MKVLGLDLSSSTGYAVIHDGALVRFGTATASDIDRNHPLPEYNQVRVARCIANRIFNVLKSETPDLIVIEQTNLGQNRNDQKGLEFIHFAMLDVIEILGMDKKIAYIDSSAWRTGIDLKLTPEQRKHNKLNSSKKRAAKVKGNRFSAKKGEGKITWKHLSVNWVNQNFNLNFKLSQNDMADAICLAVFGSRMVEESKKNSITEFDLKVFS